jgi:hypothetical protein
MILCLLAATSVAAQAWEPGNHPVAPARMHTAGFAVDNHERDDVLAFWHAVYQSSEGYEDRIGWTGNYNGNSGTVSKAFVGDVERRLNFFRALCGLDSNASVSLDSTVFIDPADPVKPAPSTPKAAAAQQAALMLVRNFNASTGQNPALTHYPPGNLVGWSPSAWNATSKGNFAFGLFGPGAITEYMVEQLSSSTAISSWNSLVGHRRWNLYPRARVFATGDQPGTSAYVPPTNVFYVVQKPSELIEEPASKFVAYPAAGFFPAPINSPFWSLSRDGADFSFATVKMTDAAGKSVAVSNVRRNADYGDPAIIWEVSPSAAVRSVYNDTSYQVTVSGIGGEGIPASFSYTVTLINPDRLLTNQQISGPARMAAGKSAQFSFSPSARAEALQVVAAVRQSTAWKETAEKSPKVIDGTGSNYPLQVKTASFPGFGHLSGSTAFRLTFPTSYDIIRRGVPDQFFELDREIIANSKAKLNFLYRRGYMTRSSTLAVEFSANGGVTWKTLGSPIKGVSDTQYDVSVSSASIPLPKSATPIRIRFRYYTNGGSIYTHEAAKTAPTGIFIDDITVKNCDWLESKKTTYLGATAGSFTLSSATAGAKLAVGSQWHLRLRTRLGGKWFPHGPSKAVVVAGK